MKLLKKNQLTILVIALMFVTAGYLSYTTKQPEETSASAEDKLAAIGDAALVNSGEIIEKEDQNTILNNIENTTNVIGDSISSQNNVDNTTNTENSQTSTTSANVIDNYFANSRLERETMYSQMLETYQKLLESTSISQEQKAVSQEQINKINQTKNGIMIAENLIKTKGFSDVVMFVNDGSVSVVMQANELSTEEIAQIQNIVSRELKVEIENIHISKK